MINMFEVNETNQMIEHENLDVRTITLGISLLDCCDSDINEVNRKIYEKITATAKDLVSTGQAEYPSEAEIAKCLGVPAGTVKSRLARARKQLKELLQGQEGGYGTI